MHIVYASDDHYFTYIYVSIVTLMESNDNMVIHYLHQDVPDEHLDILRQIPNSKNIEIDIRPFEMPDFFSILPACGAASKTTYAKFLFSSIFMDLKKVLYLDPDTMVLGNIEEMYYLDLEDCLIAGVRENLPNYHRDVCGLDQDDLYINGGMVLCNLNKWRESDFEEKAIERIQDTRLNLNYDQGIINELCKRKIYELPPKYNALAEVFTFKDSYKIKKRYSFNNYYSQEEIDEAIVKPVIIHFTHFLFGKPMSYKCTHPYTRKFQEIVLSSPLKESLTYEDIPRRAKIRKFILNYCPFSVYLLYEKIMDIRRKSDVLKGKSI